MPGSESDAVASELRKRKESQTVESSENVAVETISEPTQKPDEPASNVNDDIPSEPSETETVKSVDDKKNE